MAFQKIGIAADHAGKKLKSLVKDYVSLLGFSCTDFGVDDQISDSVDYPDFASYLSQAYIDKKIDAGIAICGSGIGMCITCNKFPGIRAASVSNSYTAEMSRRHNDANILCLGARTLDLEQVYEIVKIWLETPFEGERHSLRIHKIQELEKKLKK